MVNERLWLQRNGSLGGARIGPIVLLRSPHCNRPVRGARRYFKKVRLKNINLQRDKAFQEYVLRSLVNNLAKSLEGVFYNLRQPWEITNLY